MVYGAFRAGQERNHPPNVSDSLNRAPRRAVPPTSPVSDPQLPPQKIAASASASNRPARISLCERLCRGRDWPGCMVEGRQGCWPGATKYSSHSVTKYGLRNQRSQIQRRSRRLNLKRLWVLRRHLASAPQKLQSRSLRSYPQACDAIVQLNGH